MTECRSVLIVEDEPLISMMLEDFLDALGHRVAGTVDTVAAALEQVAAGDFDVAILDVNLARGEPCWPVADALVDKGKPFLLSTGGHVAPPPDRHACAPALSKPYTMAGVQQALAALTG